MSEFNPLDPRALKLYTDGNSYKNPGGAGGFACVAEYPDYTERESEIVIQEGFHETSINRMELLGCIRALEYVAERGSALGVERVLIITDSKYVAANQNMPATWRRNGWKNSAGRPIENSDLWKRFLTVRTQVRVRTEIVWRKGKKTSTLKKVDRAAKDAGKSPWKVDRGFRAGKVSRSKMKTGASSLYPAAGQNAVIRVYRSALIRKTGHKIFFDVIDQATGASLGKFTAYVTDTQIADLHRGHCYHVRFNMVAAYPQLEEILCEVPREPG